MNVVCGLRSDLFSDFVVMVLKAFIDDSGSGGDSPWFVLAGFASTVEKWAQFDVPWLGALYSEPRIEFLKTSEAERLHGQFRGFTAEQRDAKLDALICVIEQCVEWPISVRVRPSDYDNVFKGRIPEIWDDPYYFLYHALVGSTSLVDRRYGEDRPLEFVMDTHQRHAKLEDKLNTGIRHQSSLGAVSSFGGISNVTFRDEKDFLPLQPADLYAWHIRRFFSVTSEPQRPLFHRLRAVGSRPFHEHIVERDELELMKREMRQRGRALGWGDDMTSWPTGV